MNLFDIGLLTIALLSVITGALRGFMREAAALGGWVLAVVLAIHFSAPLGRQLPLGGTSDGVRAALAGGLIVLACVLAAHLVGRLLSAAMAAAQLGGPDRALGALFGMARATAVWLLIAAAVLHIGLSQRPFWSSSRLAPWLEAALRWISPELTSASHWAAAPTGA